MLESKPRVRVRPRILIASIALILVIGSMAFWSLRGRAPGSMAPSPAEHTGPQPTSVRLPSPPPIEEKPFSTVTVFYATDRKLTKDASPNRRYGSDQNGSLTYGSAEVSIPRDHHMGQIESPSWLRFEFRPDPEKHVILVGVSPIPGAPEFSRRLSAHLNTRPAKELLVFVHGFNVDFSEAIKRTAQITYDLGFPGVPITYTWASLSKLSLTAYKEDGRTADATAPRLREFLTLLSKKTGAERIHVIAHSMGNRVLTQALEGITVDPAAAGPLLSEVMLTAPDVDEEVMRALALRFVRTAERFTLYASERDSALTVAQKYTKKRRAGQGGSGILVVPRIDSIEASKVDTDLVGHSYYGDNRSVLSDMFYVLRTRRRPPDRFGMLERQRGRDVFWEFAP